MDLVPDQIDGADAFLQAGIVLCVLLMIGLGARLWYQNRKQDQ